MKRIALPLLTGLCAALALVLAFLWLDGQGQLRNIHWRAPTPVAPDFADMLHALPEPTALSTARFMVLLERPLFSEKRRPPPPAPVAQAAPSDVMSKAQLVAVYTGAQQAGVILMLEGKSRRLRLGEQLDGWQLTAVQERSASFMHSGQLRQLPLIRAKVGSKEAAPPR